MVGKKRAGAVEMKTSVWDFLAAGTFLSQKKTQIFTSDPI